MKELLLYIDEYGLLVVVAGLMASILCGCIKIPIVNAIKKRNLGEKATSNRITTICTVIVAFFSIALIVSYQCLKAHSFEPLKTGELYSQILLAISFAKIAYMLYEGIGVVSIKKWAHELFFKISENLKNKKQSSAEEYTNIVQAVLRDTLHMPLTDEQTQLLKDKLLKKDKEESSDE